MSTGIVGASLTTLTNGTTINAPDVLGNDQALKTNGVDNCGGLISTDGAGGVTVVSVSNAQGIIRGMFLETTPPLLANNITLNSGVTNTYTCTGIGTPTIPSGIKAVFLHVQCTPSGAGAQTTFVAHGTTWVAGQHPSVAAPVSGQAHTASFWVAVDAGGQIDVKGNFQNVTGLFIGIGAYLY